MLTAQTLPKLEGKTVDGRPLVLPDEIEMEWAVILGYRAHW